MSYTEDGTEEQRIFNLKGECKYCGYTKSRLEQPYRTNAKPEEEAPMITKKDSPPFDWSSLPKKAGMLVGSVAILMVAVWLLGLIGVGMYHSWNSVYHQVTTNPVVNCRLVIRSEWGHTQFEVCQTHKFGDNCDVLLYTRDHDEAVRLTHSKQCGGPE